MWVKVNEFGNQNSRLLDCHTFVEHDAQCLDFCCGVEIVAGQED